MQAQLDQTQQAVASLQALLTGDAAARPVVEIRRIPTMRVLSPRPASASTSAGSGSSRRSPRCTTSAAERRWPCRRRAGRSTPTTIFESDAGEVTAFLPVDGDPPERASSCPAARWPCCVTTDRSASSTRPTARSGRSSPSAASAVPGRSARSISPRPAPTCAGPSPQEQHHDHRHIHHSPTSQARPPPSHRPWPRSRSTAPTRWSSGGSGRPCSAAPCRTTPARATSMLAGSPAWSFMAVPEAKSAKNRVHVDLAVDDLPGTVDRLVALGATQARRLRRERLPMDHAHRPGGQRVRRRRGELSPFRDHSCERMNGQFAHALT